MYTMKNTILLLFAVFVISGCSKGSEDEPKAEAEKPASVMTTIEQSSRGFNPQKFVDKAQSAADKTDAHLDAAQEHLYDDDL